MKYFISSASSNHTAQRMPSIIFNLLGYWVVIFVDVWLFNLNLLNNNLILSIIISWFIIILHWTFYLFSALVSVLRHFICLKVLCKIERYSELTHTQWSCQGTLNFVIIMEFSTETLKFYPKIMIQLKINVITSVFQNWNKNLIIHSGWCHYK